MNKASVIVGPGHHHEELIRALKFNNVESVTFRYWPSFSVCSEGSQYSPFVGKLYDISSHISYGVRHRLYNWLGYYWPMDHLFKWYDKLVARQLSFDGSMLIGWPQVSKHSFSKWKKEGGKCILEHPMIHVLEWMEIMQNAYGNLSDTKGYHSLFSSEMVKRMLEEYELADKINVLSTYSYNSFIKFGISPDKLVVTTLGIDTEKFKVLNNKYSKGKFIFLFVGRLEILKGVHLLVQAFKELQFPDAELWLVGDKRKETESYLHGENIKLLGVKNKVELVEIYNQVNCLVLPSLQESFGLVLLEAMACGLPVIASNNTGGPDIITEPAYGYIFQSGNLNDLKEKMVLMKNDQSFSKDQISTYIESKFALINYFEKYKLLLNACN